VIHHIAITTENPQLLSEFYLTLPGLEFLQEFREKEILRSAWFRIHGSSSVLMIERGSPAAPYALVFDLNSCCEESQKSAAAANGGTISCRNLYLKRKSQTDYTFYFLDPDGNRLGYSSFPKKLTEFLYLF